MDHPTDQLLRPSTKLADYVYCMGYCGASRSGAGGWHYLPAFQQKMVCSWLMLRYGVDGWYLGTIGRYGGGSIDCCCGRVKKLTGVWKLRRRASQEPETRWGG